MGSGVLTQKVEQALSEKGFSEFTLASNNGDSNADCWRASHPDYTEPVITKVSAPEEVDEAGNDPFKLSELAEREVQIYGMIDHDSIPDLLGAFAIFPYGSELRQDVVVLEDAKMPTLQTWMDEDEALTESQAKNIVRDVLEGLHHIHTELPEQVLHRDLKPSHIYSDGRSAMMSDFNWSSIGEQRTIASTKLDNLAYYPTDSWVAPTGSQDLVALGNCILATAYNSQIALLREKQGKQPLEQPEVSDLPYSPKFQRFLKVLTATTPAFRYQSAALALEDLLNLDNISDEEWEERVTSVNRDPRMENLLGLLEKHDPLYSYNVPPKMHREEDERLLEDLRHTYTKPEFIVTDRDVILDSAQSGSQIIKVGDRRSRLLDNNVPGRISGFGEEAHPGKIQILVAWSKHLVDPVDIEVTGYGREFMFNYSWDPISAVDFQDKAPGKFKALKIGMDVTYTGEPVYSDVKIPDGVRGTVLERVHHDTHKKPSDSYAIIWHVNQGVAQTVNRYLTGEGGRRIPYYRPDQDCLASDIALVVENNVDFDALYEQAFSDAS